MGKSLYQYNLFEIEEYRNALGNCENKNVLIGLSGGINSMAILCALRESGIKPNQLHLYYAHFKQHSPGTERFVTDGIRFARMHFKNVFVKITRNDVIKYFLEQGFIPHPTISPCTKNLKIIPMMMYAKDNNIDIDLVGYVRKEINTRIERQKEKLKNIDNGIIKSYPIMLYDDDWCLHIVKSCLGWYPAIYDIVDDKGKRVFKHNNCLPCKNFEPVDYKNTAIHYPEYYNSAEELSLTLRKHWGRTRDDFYNSFDNRELGQDSSCDYCKV